MFSSKLVNVMLLMAYLAGSGKTILRLRSSNFTYEIQLIFLCVAQQ